MHVDSNSDVNKMGKKGKASPSLVVATDINDPLTL